MPAFNSLPLDYTGTAVTNLVQDELHVLEDKQVRTIAPQYGGYFTDSLIVRDAVTNAIIHRSAYKCMDILGMPSLKADSEICSVICIVDPNVGARLRITYQAVGGIYIKTYETIKKLMDALTLDDRPAAWPNILRKPNTFNPTPHMQSIATVVGFEFVVEALDSLKSAILLGDCEDHNEILAYIDDQIGSFKGQINNRFESEITDALQAAQQAKADATQALTTASQLTLTANQLASRAAAAIDTIDDLKAVNNNAATAAQAIIDDALAGRVAVKRLPPTQDLVDVTLPDASFTTGVIDSDFFSIDASGQVSVPGDLGEFISNDVFRVSLQSEKADNDLLRIRFILDCKDRRSTLFYQEVTDAAQAFIANKTVNDGTRDRKVYLDGGTGYYADDLDLILYPFLLSDNKTDTDTAPEVGHMVVVQPHSSILNITYSGLNSKQYPISGIAQDETEVRFWVLGEDDETMPGTVLNDASRGRFMKYLFDTRNDYNALGYGDIPMRRAIRVAMVPGTKINISVALKALSPSDAYRTISLVFKKYFKIKRTSNWNVQATNGAITSAVEVKTVTNAGPDAARMRCVAVDISTNPVEPSTSQDSLIDPPAAPQYFIADQFQASFTNYDTTAPTHRSLSIKNISTATIAIDSIEHWSAATGDRTALVQNVNFLPSATLTYSNQTHSVVNMPITAQGGGNDYAEQIRLYLANGQLIIFKAMPGQDYPGSWTSTGEGLSQYVPVFSSLVFNPSVVAKTQTSQLTATFTGLKPSATTTVDVVELTGQTAQSISLQANASGVATHTWPVVMGNSNVTYRANIAGTVRTAVLTRGYSAVFSGLSVNPANAIEGASAQLKAEFTGLKPNATNAIVISSAQGVPAGTIEVDANASGYGFYTWPTTVGSADKVFTMTINAVTDSVTLMRRYVPVLSTVEFDPSEWYNGRITRLVCTFTDMRPNEDADVVINLDPNGDTQGPSGDQTVTLSANAAGVAQERFVYEMNNEDFNVIARYRSTTLTATCRNAGPDLDTVEFTSVSAREGTRVRLAIAFKNVPLSGAAVPVQFEIAAPNGYTELVGPYGLRGINVPSGQETYITYIDYVMQSATTKINVTLRGVTKQALIKFAQTPELASLSISAGLVSSVSTTFAYMNFSGLEPNKANTITGVSLSAAEGLAVDARAWGNSGATGFGTRNLTISADEDGNGSARVAVDITGYGGWGVRAEYDGVTKITRSNKVHDVTIPTAAIKHAAVFTPGGVKSIKAWIFFKNDGTVVMRKRNVNSQGTVIWDNDDQYLSSWIPGASQTVSKEQFADLYEIGISTTSEVITGKYQNTVGYTGPAKYVYPAGTAISGMSNLTDYASLARPEHAFVGVSLTNDWRLINREQVTMAVTIRHASTNTVLATKNITFDIYRSNPHPDLRVTAAAVQSSASSVNVENPYIKFLANGKLVSSVNGAAEVAITNNWIVDAGTVTYDENTTSEYEVSVTPTAFWIESISQSSVMRTFLFGNLAPVGTWLPLNQSSVMGVDPDAQGNWPGWTNKKYAFNVKIRHRESDVVLVDTQGLSISASLYTQEDIA